MALRTQHFRPTRIAPLIALTMVVLGLLAAANAQASTTEWAVQGNTFEALSIEKETISLGSGPLTLSVPAKELVLECPTVEGTGTVKKGGTDEVTLTLSKCTVVKLSCKVVGSISLKFKSEGLAGGIYDNLEGLTEKTFGTIKFEEGTGCPVALSNNLKGNVAAEAKTELESSKRKLIFSKAISEAANAALKAEKKSELSLLFGESAATLSGELFEKMTGAKAEQPLFRSYKSKLCEAEAADCAPTQTYQPTQVIKAKSLVANAFKFGGNTITCNEMTMDGEITNNNTYAVTGKFPTVAFTGCTATCVVSPVGTPWSFYFASNGNKKDGRFGIGVPFVTIVCTTPAVNCKFRLGIKTLAFTEFEFFGGKPGKFNSFPHGLEIDVGTCATGTWGSTGAGGIMKNEFPTPADLFIAGKD
jgi:hypothetical protein